jgi:hypothetical protein
MQILQIKQIETSNLASDVVDATTSKTFRGK